jgi:regulatory protein SWI6
MFFLELSSYTNTVDMTSMIQNLEADFAIEVKAKQDQLDVTQGQLRAATRELAEQRRQMQLWQATCAELDEVQQRIRNVERAIRDEEKFDWVVSKSAESNMIGDRTSDATTQVAGSMMEIDVMSSDSEPVVPPTNTLASLIQLRRLKTWHSQIESAMNDRLSKLKGASAEKEFQCKKIVSLCTGVALENVEAVCFILSVPGYCSSQYATQMLENLVIAMESDGPVPELARVSGFMQKVRAASSA